MKGLLSKSKSYDVGFICLLIALFYFFNFQNYFFLHPQGVHFIRQTDSLSFVSNYYNNGFHFFTPSLYNLASINGNGVCEFPILYYLASVLYIIFGEKEFILKLIHLLIFFIGLFHVYKLSYLVLKDYMYSYLVPFFILASTSLVYYSFNFLPDIAALGFALSGWYFGFKFKENKVTRPLIFSIFFFLISSLLKVTYLINPFAFLGMSLIEFLLVKKQDTNSRKIILKQFYYFGISFLVVMVWNVFVFFYNIKNQSTYFTTSILPIWDLTIQERSIYWNDILSEWYKKYLAETSFHALLLGLIFIGIFFKKIPINLKLALLFSAFGTISYFLLFFQQFRFHDYYYLLFFPFIIFILLSFFQIWKQLFPNNLGQNILKFVFLVIIASGLNYSRIKLEERYYKGNDLNSKIGFQILKNKQFIDDVKIPKDSKVLIGPDLSVNGGLYFIKRKGWPINNADEITKEKINFFKSQGADYFILVNDSKSQKILDDLGRKLFKNRDLSIYKL